jgi:hypothetical protein
MELQVTAKELSESDWASEPRSTDRVFAAE